MISKRSIVPSLIALLALAAPSATQVTREAQQAPDLPRVPERDFLFQELEDGSILVTDANQQLWFASFNEYVQSGFFEEKGLRCGSGALPHPVARGTTNDCSSSNTNVASEYEPSGGALYEIPVVVHVLRRKNGAGNVSDALINSQIDVLNEDFRAIGGTPGGGGNDARIQFTLAGITRTRNNTWYNDGGSYWNTLAWDTTRYLNIYTNQAGGNLGYAYVPSGGGVVGNAWDRVVIYWQAMGRPAPYGAPYNQGRTATHEVGHYLGLYHTFDGGCATGSSPACYGNGDLICDTNPESGPNYRPCSRSTCGSPDPTENYMDYSDDLCMTEFTNEQVNRMRCTLDNFRVDLGSTGNPPGKASNPSPTHGAGGVSTGATLAWTAGSGADSHDVYFGTDSTPDAGEFAGNQTTTTYDPGPLSSNTTYYWRVDEVNPDGTTTGDVWSFTTLGGGGGFTLNANGYKVKGRQRVDLDWSGGGAGPFQVYRDGTLIESAASSPYTDDIGARGGGTYVYQVCDGGNCSNSATVVF